MNIMVADSIELRVLKLRLAISDRLNAVGLIADVRDIVFDYVWPYGADETYFNRYSGSFETELIAAGVAHRLYVDIYSSNYSNYDGCVKHDREVPWPHMEIMAYEHPPSEHRLCLYHVMNFSDIFQCFDMSAAHINILTMNIHDCYISSEISKIIRLCEHLDAFEKIARMFMDTIWFGPAPR